METMQIKISKSREEALAGVTTAATLKKEQNGITLKSGLEGLIFISYFG
ncbi:MAG: hypothetical protein WBD22_02225 [Pyrinomonadaceae bacterium]